MKESARAKLAWADYLALGEGRSFEKLLQCYHGAINRPPTTRLKSLADWSRLFGWQRRLADLADAEAQRIAEEQAAYRRAIMQEGLALDHERVRILKDLASVLHGELTAAGDGNRRWLRDVKQIGSGDSAERVDLERFNAGEVEQLRGLLDDIAKEKGERKQTQDNSGTLEVVIREMIIERTNKAEAAPLPLVIERSSGGNTPAS